MSETTKQERKSSLFNHYGQALPRFKFDTFTLV